MSLGVYGVGGTCPWGKCLGGWHFSRMFLLMLTLPRNELNKQISSVSFLITHIINITISCNKNTLTYARIISLLIQMHRNVLCILRNVLLIIP